MAEIAPTPAPASNDDLRLVAPDATSCRPGSDPVPDTTPTDARPTVFPAYWLGAHGGAGTTSLAAATSAIELRQPFPELDAGTKLPVLVACRSNHNGLAAAQHTARLWSQPASALTLVGLVVVADAPGRQPKPLRELRFLAGGAYRQVWDVEWFEPWRLGQQPSPLVRPKAVDQLVAELTAQANTPT